ncbi:hypothetical protein BC829DRAFT_445722 [Chytridium lagenaria]|nr:hypothetical protein BC829DRAFT_445722 [Chytridium lagenaria]
MKSPMDTSNLWTASTSDGMDMFEDISVSTVWNGHSECPTIHVFAPEDEGALSDSTSIRLGSEPEFKGEPSKQIVARTRWERLVWAQKSIGGSLEQIAEIKDTVAVRFYLACSDSDQLWAFRQVVETLIDTLDPERGHVELSECMSKLDRISYRVDILSQLGIHGSQKAERLRSYYKEGCRLWRGIRGGDLSLRVSGYGGDVGREEHVYRHLANVVVPSFSGDA